MTEGSTTQIQALLDLAAEGKQDAYDDLIALASERLLRLTRKMLRCYPHLRRWEQTDDIFQNAAIRLHRSLAEVKPDSVRAFFGLAATQIRRSLIDLCRHHFGPQGHAAKHETQQMGAANGDPIQDQPDSSDPQEAMASWATFHQSVEDLPADQREVFQIVWYGGLDQKQAAQLLGISISTVQRRWYSACHRIEQFMGGQSPLGY